MRRRELLALSLVPFLMQLKHGEWRELKPKGGQRVVKFDTNWKYNSSISTWINKRDRLYLRDITLNRWAANKDIRYSVTTQTYVKDGWECHTPTGEIVVDLP